MLTSSITKAIIEKCDNDTKKEDSFLSNLQINSILKDIDKNNDILINVDKLEETYDEKKNQLMGHMECH